MKFGISRELGLAMTTIQSWTSHLIGSYLWHEVPSFSGNMIRRVIRRAKGYFSDTGFACHLMRISSQEALLGHPSLGALFETLIVNEIKNGKQISSHSIRGLKAFSEDYPMATTILLYRGTEYRRINNNPCSYGIGISICFSKGIDAMKIIFVYMG